MKHIYPLFLSLLFAALLLGGCGRQEGPSSDPLPTPPETAPTQVSTTRPPTL